MAEGQTWPATTKDIAGWAISKGLWKPQRSSLVRQFAEQLSRSMREEYIRDPQGRAVRAKHTARPPTRRAATSPRSVGGGASSPWFATEPLEANSERTIGVDRFQCAIKRNELPGRVVLKLHLVDDRGNEIDLEATADDWERR